MPRKPRIHYDGALYHVIVRGNNRSYIFESDETKKVYLNLIKKYKEKYDCKLYAYVIMNNHAHLLIQVSNIPLSKPMQLIQQTFTQYYNRLKKETGHVFEQRYKAVLCDKEKYLMALIKYIHENPTRAGMGSNYKWSSHREYKEYNEIYCDIQFPLSIFSDKSSIAVREYLKFMDKNESIDYTEDYEIIPNEIVETYKEELHMDLNYDQIVKQFIAKYEINYEDLIGRSKNREIVKIKEEFIKTIIKNKVMSQRELADKLKVTEQTVSRIYNKC